MKSQCAALRQYNTGAVFGRIQATGTSPPTTQLKGNLMSNIRKQTAIEFVKIAYNATKIIAVSMTALISCIGLMYLIGWRGDTALFGGMLVYLVMGAVWCMFDSAKHTAKMKEKYPDLEL